MQFTGMWLPFQDRVLLLAYKQQASFAVRNYDSIYSRNQKSLLTCKAFDRKIPQTELLHVVFFKDQACTCICTSTWVAPSNICVNTGNMRNVFYYKIPEYAHCPQ